MDYEKKYKEDLKSAKEWYKIAKEQDNKLAIDILESKFPELVESEDERIRNSIIHLVEKSQENGGYALHKDEAEKMLDWLEKQGEHQKFRDTIQVGDKVTRNEDGVLVNLSQLKRVAKPADVIESEKQSEQKLAWSEDDEKIGKELIDFCIKCSQGHTVVNSKNDFTRWTTWLKSRKPQNKWKPSEEQLDVLEKVINRENTGFSGYRNEILTSLYDELKQLK